jgi:3-hydroxyacyl-[acyl-carrier-protein] dehydratase
MDNPTHDAGLDRLLALLPHRAPMLLVDRILEDEAPQRLVAQKTVRADEPTLQGHFPGCPILPGVMLIEALAQAACLLAARTPDTASGRVLPALMGVRDASFLRPVRPGDTLDLEVVRLRTWGRFWQVQGTARIAGAPVARAVLTATLVDADFVAPSAPAAAVALS